MRTLPTAITTAAGLLASAPDCKVEMADSAPHFALLSQVGAMGSRCSGCLAPDGALVMAYVAGGSLYSQRVVNPMVVGTGGWGAWSLRSTNALGPAGCCLATVGGTTRLLFQQGTGTAVQCFDSLDGGITWGAATTLFDPGHPCWGLGIDADLATVILAYNPGSGLARLAAWKLSGSWAGADWPGGDLTFINGLAVGRQASGVYLVLIASLVAGTAGVQYLTYTPTSSYWSATKLLRGVDLANGLTLSNPHLAYWAGDWRATYVEADSGSVSGQVFTRPVRTSSVDGVHWTTGETGACTAPGGAVWLAGIWGQVLAGPEAVMAAPAYNPGTGYRDMSGDLIKLELVEAEGKPGRLLLTLDNNTGQYSAAGALKMQAEVVLSQGYVGVGLVPTHRLYVVGWSFLRAADRAEVQVTCLERSERLLYESLRPASYSNATLLFIASDLLARSGLDCIVTQDGSLQMSELVPAFQVLAGEPYARALARLFGAYTVAWRTRVAAGTGALGAVESVDLLAKASGAAVVWSWNGEPESVSVRRDGSRANRLSVRGPAGVPTAVGDAWDQADIQESGRERYALAVEMLAGDAGTAYLTAGLALAREQRLAVGLQAAVPPHPGLELLDVVSVSDPLLPATSARLVGLRLLIEPKVGWYGLVVHGEGV
jgi:hypothetical protein